MFVIERGGFVEKAVEIAAVVILQESKERFVACD
jgi:hypothetical protein